MNKQVKAALDRKNGGFLITGEWVAPCIGDNTQRRFDARDANGVISDLLPLEEGQKPRDILSKSADLQPLIDEIRETYRLRTDLLRAKNRLVLQVQSLCRRLVAAEIPGEFDDKKRQKKVRVQGKKLYNAIYGKGSHPLSLIAAGYSEPLMAAIAVLDGPHKVKVKQLEKLAKQLPVWDSFGKDTCGFGALSFACIIGETGNLSNYATVSRVWKRMGLAVIDGERQRKVAGDAEKAIRHGYNPQRRSVMYVIGETMIKKKSLFRTKYDNRKAYETETYPDKCKAFWYERAKRYMTKELLKYLWRAWKLQHGTVSKEVNLTETKS